MRAEEHAQKLAIARRRRVVDHGHSLGVPRLVRVADLLVAGTGHDAADITRRGLQDSRLPAEDGLDSPEAAGAKVDADGIV